MITPAHTKNGTLLTEVEAKKLLGQAGIPVNETKLAQTRKEAVAIAQSIDFPVVLKIVSPDISHKTDMGGVKLGLANAAQTGKAYKDIMTSISQKAPSAKILGVSVQRMARPGIELIVGVSQDPQFGPVLMFGMGGILVEILKDVSFRLIPLTRRDAAEMVREIKGYAVLKGYRGQEPVNISALEDLIVKVSNFIMENPQVNELDLNPVLGYQDGMLAVDARIVLK